MAARGATGWTALGIAAAAVAVFPCMALAVSRIWDGGGANALASNPTNWVDDIAPAANDAIILDVTSHKAMTWNLTNTAVASWTQVGYLGTVTVATVYGTNGFTALPITGDCVISNGVWTHAANGTTEANRLRVIIGGNLVLGTGAVIDVTAKGYQQNVGPGASGRGASHGGRGRYDPVAIAGPCYGSVVAPTNLGSGSTGGSGGGAMWLTVSGVISHEGLLRAEGWAASSYSGSGGSIYLVAGALAGAGAIQANAGFGYWGGGGGRIAVVLTNAGADFAGFTGTISAYSRTAAAAGTIYLERPSDAPGKGELVVNNSGGAVGYSTFNTDLSGVEAVAYDFGRLTLTNGGNLCIGANDSLVMTNTVLASAAGQTNGIWIDGGTLLAPPSFVCSNVYIVISAAGSTFSPTNSLSIATNGVLLVNQPHGVSGDVIVEAGGTLTHTANGSTEAYRMNLTVGGSLTVKSGGSVDVTGRGFPLNCGPGTPLAGNAGGSHGGLGVGGSSCYGSIVAPTNIGSGGRSIGAGGGAIQLAVSGTVSNGGRLCANASPAALRTGSGGSIYITAGTLTGSGPIEANSATNVTGDSPGGGGRIALAVTNAGADFSAYPTNRITAFGGRKAGGSGGAGTVYLRTAGQGLHEGTLIVDNDDLTGLRAEISSNVTEAVVGDVILRNKGGLALATNQSVALSGVWSNGASFVAQLGSQVIFAGAASSTSTICGSNTFMGLICTSAGKTLLFEAGSTNRVDAVGRFWMQGAEGTPVTLRSTSGSAAWRLDVAASADQAVEHVDVADSDASFGVEVTAVNSVNSGGNTNWRFETAVSGETNLWTGGSSTVWSARGNWDRDRAPLETDAIVIPAGRPRYPVLDADRTIASLDLATNTSLELSGFDLTVAEPAVVAGALICAGVETVVFRKEVTVSGSVTARGMETFILMTNADFSGCDVDAAMSTVSMAGGGAQAVDLGGATFYRVWVENVAGPITLEGGFTATEFRCEAANGTRSLTFQQGTTVTLRDLVLLGSVATTNLTLRSSSPGQKWNLAVSGYRSVRGVDVQDSDASSGMPIPAVFSKDSGGNPNWVFGATWSTWLGTSGNNFHTAANWSPIGVPVADSRVWVDVTNTMVITGAVTVLDLTVGGGSGAASVTANAGLTVTESITVLNHGTLALNRPSVVSNDLIIAAGGTMTHSANTTTEANKLEVTVCGDMAVDRDAAVTATGKGYKDGSGPGTGTGQRGAGYGGLGGTAAGVSGPCYGSMVAPTNLGSGAANSAGGGAIILRVTGALRNDGLICADGVPVVYAGSGGSVYGVASSFTGSGVIRATGGAGGSAGSGGGGRIAVVVTGPQADFSGYTGSMEAFGGVGGAAAGTVYQKCAADKPGRGTVRLANNAAVNRYADVPPATNYVIGEVDYAPFHITNAARLRLTNDFTVGDIWLDSADTWLDLGFRTLTVHSREHPLGLGTVTNYGAIVWVPETGGTLFVVH